MTYLKAIHCIYFLMFVEIISYYDSIVWFSVVCLLEGLAIFNRKDTSWSFIKRQQDLYFQRIEKIFNTFPKKLFTEK